MICYLKCKFRLEYVAVVLNNGYEPALESYSNEKSTVCWSEDLFEYS